MMRSFDPDLADHLVDIFRYVAGLANRNLAIEFLQVVIIYTSTAVKDLDFERVSNAIDAAFEDDCMQDITALSPDERRALLAKLLKEKAGRQSPPQPQSYPLSFAQQRLWFLDKLQPDSSTYNVCRAFWLEGPLDVGALERGLQKIANRHQSLRTTFAETEDGRPIQIVSPDAEPTLTTIDLRRAADPKAEAIKQMNREALRPFNLSSGFLFRPYLWQTAENQRLFLVVMHHIISDAWSLSVFFNELSLLYEEELTGSQAALPPLAVQYTGYAQQQRARLQGETLEKHLAFWKEHLAGRRQLLDLPTDHPRPPVQRFNGRSLDIALPKTLSGDIKAFSQRQKTTPYTTFLAAFNLLLHRYTGSRDIIIGSPTANRNDVGVQALIGFFVNVMPVRTDLSGDPTFVELLRQVRQTLISAMPHRELPFERLVDEVQPERDLSRHPVFQVALTMQNVPDDRPNLPGITAVSQNIPVQSSKFDLTFFLKETAAGYSGTIEYSTDLFEPETIGRMAGHFQRLMEGIVANPDARLSELPILPDEERRRLVFDWNQTGAAFSTRKLAHQMVEEQAAGLPGKTAVTDYQSADQVGTQLSFEQLNGRANQLARILRRMGVGPETPVGVCMGRSAEMVVALLAVWKAGGAYLPLDPVYPRERLAFMLRDAAQMGETADPILITQPALKAQMPSDGIRRLYLDAGWETIEGESSDNLECVVSAENLAYIIYTSGTTGRPKGIQLEHRSLLNLIHWHQRAFEVTEADAATQVAGPAFDASVWELWPYLTAGAAIHIPDDETRLLPWQMRDWLAAQGITLAFLPTPLAEAIMTLEWPRETPLRKLLTGGDKLAHFPPPDLPFELVNNYGPTENTVVTTSERTPPAGETAEPPPIGRPIDNVQLYITDRHFNPVPIGVPGELLIGGESLARGYLNRPDLTAAAFIPDPFHPEQGRGRQGRRLYRTGDLVKYLPDGRIAFLGRIDQQVKIRGFRIELSEIETALGQHSAVAEALALAREETPGDKRLVGYLIPNPGSRVDPDELRRFLGQRLPEYMVPAAFVALSEWPLTPNGKIDRRALPAPDWHAAGREQVITEPRTPEEETLAAIWREVLGLSRVGVHENFFELGGDSILSIQILARANQAGFNLTTRQFFQHQTIASLAAAVGQGETAAPAIKAEQGRASGSVPLTPIQRWFFEQKLADPGHWNMAMLLDTKAHFSPEAAAQALEALIEHHDALRLRYVKRNGVVDQHYVNSNGGEIFSYVNLSGLPEGEQEARFAETAEKTQRSLNLTEGPLIKAVFFDYGEGEPGRLLIVIHHLVVDGVSWRVLLEDLYNVYEQLMEGWPVQLPQKTVSFRQWSNALAAFAQSKRVTAELDHWLAQPWRDVGRLPRDFTGGEAHNLVETAETITTALTRQETQTLLQAVPAAYGARIDDVLLTALGQTFAAWCGCPTMLVDMEGHGREDISDALLDTSRTVGWFTSMYPVVLRVEEEAEPPAAVAAIQRQFAAIPGKGLSYGLLRYFRPDLPQAAQLQTLPQAEVSFNYLGQFDRILPPDSPFCLSNRPVKHTRSPRSRRKHLLNINGRVVDGRLEISWTYSRRSHRAATIAQLAQRYQANLQRLIEERPLNGVPRAVYLAIRQSAAAQPIEAIWPAAPGQAAMLAHTHKQPDSAAYFLQWLYTLEGRLDSAAFYRAWKLVAVRHGILRTLFVPWGHWEPSGNGTHYQMVLRDSVMDWRELDWQKLPESERADSLELLLAEDRARGFRPTAEPPLRWILVKYSQSSYRLIWSHHHALLDGWSMAPLWQEVLEAYEGLRLGQGVALRPSVPFGRYLDWVRQQPLFEAERYWRERLAGIESATSLAGPDGRRENGPYGWVEARLSAGETAALQQFAQRSRLTVNTVVQGAWARLLARRTGREEVLFGVTSAGRPSAIPGVEQIVGLLLNTLPVRVRVAGDLAGEDGRVAWLRTIQEEQAVQSQYEYVSPAQVQAWSEIPGGRPLFESFLRFQNYPMKQFLESWPGSLTIRNTQVFDQWHYPLSVVVVPEERLVVRIGFDGGLFGRGEVEGIVGEFQQLLLD